MNLVKMFSGFYSNDIIIMVILKTVKLQEDVTVRGVRCAFGKTELKGEKMTWNERGLWLAGRRLSTVERKGLSEKRRYVTEVLWT